MRIEKIKMKSLIERYKCGKLFIFELIGFEDSLTYNNKMKRIKSKMEIIVISKINVYC